MIYNESQKNRYIDHKSGGEKAYILALNNVFKTTAQFETELNKDVCCFTIEEIENMFKTLSYTSINSLDMLKSSLYMYTNWAVSELLVPDSQNHFAEIKYSDMPRYLNMNVVRKKVVSREQILDWCRQMLNPMDAFILLGFFEGIGGDNHREFPDLTSDDIDLDSHRIKLKDRGWRKFSWELCTTGLNAAETFDYYSVTSSEEKKIELEHDNRVIKNYPNVKPDADEYRQGRRIYHKLKRALDYVGADWLTAKDIRNSGISEMIKTRSGELGIGYMDYLRSETGQKELDYQYALRDIRPDKMKLLFR